ncbi:MAG: hypothetical protein B6245_02005 [Desulfobacteraceae bacterium 4572_88]|nr:MAG: hypothetical protein B6245_02005 [Desulfobacteraceae bacterium 4572_88]RLC20171.1 MAG: hypothetical protein DRI57_05435 [Deltaproteobacteria bacterium]
MIFLFTTKNTKTYEVLLYSSVFNKFYFVSFVFFVVIIKRLLPYINDSDGRGRPLCLPCPGSADMSFPGQGNHWGIAPTILPVRITDIGNYYTTF